MENQNIVEIFTDGACKGNPGNGGWGAILKYKNFRKEICGGEANTTNNRMELLAVIKALECLKTTALQPNKQGHNTDQRQKPPRRFLSFKKINC